MTILENFSVVNPFKKDCKGKGDFAEQDFISYFINNPKNKTKSLHDVRTIPDYQKIDIDFIIDNNGEKILPDINTVFIDKNRFVKVEVKYSGPALRTGKFAYEVVSHSRRGWACKTKCDYIYVVFGEELPDGSFITKKRGLINFSNWESFIDDSSNRTEIYYNKGENGIINIMTFIDEMTRKGVLKFIE